MITWLTEKEKGLIVRAKLAGCTQYFKPYDRSGKKMRKSERVSAVMQHDDQIDAYLKIAGECVNRACEKLEVKCTTDIDAVRSELSEIRAIQERMETHMKDLAEQTRQNGMGSMRQFRPKGKGKGSYQNQSAGYQSRPGHYGQQYAAPPRGGRRFQPKGGGRYGAAANGSGPVGGCYTCGGPHYERECQMKVDPERPQTAEAVAAISASLA